VTAVRIASPGELALVDEPVGPPGPGDAVVKIAYAGICGSDRELLEGGCEAAYDETRSPAGRPSA
jgi:threonine dehydrogenase-like Zn-dependent dehydrogenase